MKKHDELIILDFDHTIFNTTKYLKALKNKFKTQFNITSEEFIQHRQSIKDCCFVIDINKFVASFPKHNSAQLRKALHDVIKKQAPSFIFDDVANFIATHSAKYDIHIITHGDQELQTEKITHSNIPKNVTYTISLESKDKIIEPFFKKYKKIYFIDDKAQNIDQVKTSFPSITTYFIKRPEDQPYGNTSSKCECADHTIQDLKIEIKKGRNILFLPEQKPINKAVGHPLSQKKPDNTL